ncbi:MAG: hypothetical protein K5662_06285 [Lachnospiraceae bacterium]|nr:hypothetical protein [Lachnospiraceae bacterium]
MAKDQDPNAADLKRLKQEKSNLKKDNKRLKAEQKAQNKEAKRRARELAEEEARLMDDDGGGFSVFLITLVIVAVWIAIVCALIKLDIGGFGSGVLYPIFKDIPVVNLILPGDATMNGGEEDVDVSEYASLKDAVREINRLKSELELERSDESVKDEQIEKLMMEVDRLKTFEDKQVEFERIKNEFYNEVIYADQGPGAEEYIKYYESMDPTTAEALYKQVVREEAVDQKVKDYAQAYSEMKPAAAAEIFESMTDDLELVAKILHQMDSKSRGNILAAMDADIAARITKIMEPTEY